MPKKKPEPLSQDEKRALKILVRQRNDYVKARTRAFNRLGLDKDGKPQNVEGRIFTVDDYAILHEDAMSLKEQEHRLDLAIGRRVRRMPIWNEYLANVRGVAETTAAQIVTMIDIERATTVSKIWQYAGLNPGEVRGKKRIAADKYKGSEDAITQRFTMPDGTEQIVYVTDTMVRGDRCTEGFVAPYNAELRKVLCGIVADCMIKANSSYRLEFYDPYKLRKRNSQAEVRTGKDTHKPWSETSDGHRHNAAKRYMIKNFLKDLYATWRALEGLPVREPYAEEYLGKKHNDGNKEAA